MTRRYGTMELWHYFSALNPISCLSMGGTPSYPHYDDTQGTRNLCQIGDAPFHELSICNKYLVQSQFLDHKKLGIIHTMSLFCSLNLHFATLSLIISQLCNITSSSILISNQVRLQKQFIKLKNILMLY